MKDINKIRTKRRIKKNKDKKKIKGGETDFFIPHICSPKSDDDKLSFTCLDRDTLIDLSKKVTKGEEKRVVLEQIKDHKLEDVYETMKAKLQEEYDCSSEACLMKKDNKLLSSQKHKEIFRPELPDDVEKDKTAWLSNFDIDAVMQQFEKAYPDYDYVDATPIDFHKCSVNDELCQISLSQLKRKKKNKLGVIFNTDTSAGPGRHWIALYVDMNGANSNGKPGMYFVDSFAKEMPEQIQKLVDKFKEESVEVLGDTFTLAHNTKVFQKNNYACGYYCMHFIEEMLKGVPFSQYKEIDPDDEMMERYKNLCFVPDKIVDSA